MSGLNTPSSPAYPFYNLLASTARGGTALEASGSKIPLGNIMTMIVIVAQVVTLAIFGVLGSSTNAMRYSRRLVRPLVVIRTSYITIMIWCIYRITEMAGGWRNPIMLDQLAFVVLDSVYVPPSSQTLQPLTSSFQ